MITFDYNNILAEAIGPDHGISENELKAVSDNAERALKRMSDEKNAGKLGFLEIPYDKKISADIKQYKKRMAGRFDTIALIGIGGSALGPQALKNALSHLYLNELSADKRGDRCKAYFFDNVDPYEIRAMEDILDVSKTLFLIISKSGGTTESNANFAILLEMLRKKAGTAYKDHIVAITDPAKGLLRELATKEGFQTFPVPSNVGGRFSILTGVGLVIAEFMGIDIDGLLKGARNIIERYYDKPMRQNAPLLNACFHYIFDINKNKRINVLMPYTRKLNLFSDWYCQLWAESLGKNTDIDGKPVNVGLTPIAALGTIDQHSQLQLYLEGPNDKVITFFKLKNFENDVTIPEFYPEIADFHFLYNKSLRELNRFEEEATELVLTKNSRPNVSLIIDELDAEHIGEFIMFMEMQTAYAGYLYNINPFDQPAVEEGKKFTFGLMDKKGYESYKALFSKEYVKNPKNML